MNRVVPLRLLAAFAVLAVGAVALAASCGGVAVAGPREGVPDPSSIETRRGDVVSVFSGDVAIPAGVEQRGSIVCVGGDVTIDGRVTGDVVVVMGELVLRGEVGGALSGVLSSVTLDGGEVRRELIGIAGELTMRDAAVGRELVSVMNRFDRDETSTVRGQVTNVSLGPWFPGIWAFLFWVRMLMRLVVFVLLVLIVAIAPERVSTLADDARERYVPAFFVGILTYLALLVLLTLLSVTVIGLPLLMLVFWVVKWFGIAGLFAAVGRGLGRRLGREPSLLASVMVCFALYVLLTVVPGLAGLPGLAVAGLFSSMFFLVVTLPAVGLVVLTRGGRGTILPPLEPAGPAPAPAARSPLVPPAADDTSPPAG